MRPTVQGARSNRDMGAYIGELHNYKRQCTLESSQFAMLGAVQSVGSDQRSLVKDA
jgi:hypothetical protein